MSTKITKINHFSLISKVENFRVLQLLTVAGIISNRLAVAYNARHG